MAATGSRANLGEALLGLAVAALGAYFVYGALTLPDPPPYARIVGPRAFPLIVAGGLLLTAAGLLIQALRGDRSGEPVDWRPLLGGFAVLAAAVALLLPLGFVPTGGLIFAVAARCLGSRRTGRDLAIGLVLALAVHLAFVRGLGLSLPAGPLAGFL
ncbi:MAG TPA: tripartite tricarboxylate transporter TctB family protein [Alphaproteobacteria bacterium]|nr:tripartite tricarboxylate transporter TctB family protein [Alphaproteobacteria bacterium]